MNKLRIGNRLVGPGEPCFIVAEMSANHQQDYEKAVGILEAAARAGASAIKLQTYTADTLTFNSKKKWFWVEGPEHPEAWKGKTLYDLYQKAFTPWEWHAPLKKLAHERGLTFFSTPFDATAVEFLERLGVDCYKIASYEATDHVLLEAVARTGKPVIMSVGFASLEEITQSIQTLRANGTRELALLHCTTSYADREHPEATSLRTMMDLQQRFDVVVGFSDNMGGVAVPAYAAALGASIVEKHIVVQHDDAVLDDRFSLDQSAFSEMVKAIRWQEQVLGKIAYGPQTEAESYNRRFRRSLFAVKDIRKGERFTAENVRSIRPAYGLETVHFKKVIGAMAAEDIEAGTPLAWDLVRFANSGQ